MRLRNLLMALLLGTASAVGFADLSWHPRQPIFRLCAWPRIEEQTIDDQQGIN